MPYNYLLQPKIRESLNLVTDGSIIIFDEAHNLPGFILGTNTHIINRFDKKLKYLLKYLESFNKLCSFSNEIYTKELRLIVSRIVSYLQRHSEGSHAAKNDMTMRMTEFVQQMSVSNINVQEISVKLSKIRIYDRFIAYSSRVDSEVYEESDKHSFENFFANLSNGLKESVFLIFRFNEYHVDLKLIDYDVSSQITSITNSSRAVLFSSGTIFPVTMIILFD